MGGEAPVVGESVSVGEIGGEMRNVVRRVRSWRPARNAVAPRLCLGGICEQDAVCWIAGSIVRRERSAVWGIAGDMVRSERSTVIERCINRDLFREPPAEGWGDGGSEQVANLRNSANYFDKIGGAYAQEL